MVAIQNGGAFGDSFVPIVIAPFERFVSLAELGAVYIVYGARVNGFGCKRFLSRCGRFDVSRGIRIVICSVFRAVEMCMILVYFSILISKWSVCFSRANRINCVIHARRPSVNCLARIFQSASGAPLGLSRSSVRRHDRQQRSLNEAIPYSRMSGIVEAR